MEVPIETIRPNAIKRWVNAHKEAELCVISEQSPIEDRLNAWTHGIGFALSLAGLLILLVLALPTKAFKYTLSCSVYGFGLLSVYASSTLYHASSNPAIKRKLRSLDHISIYLLIAGTYTPFLTLALKSTFATVIFYIVWSKAAVGIIFKIFFTGRYDVLSTLFYVAMGWWAVFLFEPLQHHMTGGGVLWLAAGGACYTGGVVFYLWKNLPFNHVIWHVFVMAGSFCHFFAVMGLLP